ncbi:MAG TPA: AAA family ATPase [Bacteroidales bacterium]|nr:AAA family ATPase [Bacteroidales bacterium]
MKILNLKFKNINSLAGENEIDFTDPVFADDGLFAITGKTGAGKSSILDAISLALYGKTPRVDVTGGENAVLTRGEKDCYAEITFEVSGKVWKSTWMQSLTRTGNLNPVQRKIADANDKIIADKVRDCDREIVNILGLSFEQFTKVIMLAQGSFTAFLQADKNQKGELLEQITGTEIYGEISKKVFMRNKEESEKMAKIVTELGAIKILSDEEIQAINEEISTLDMERQTTNKAFTKKDEAKKWLTEISTLTQQINNAKQILPELQANLSSVTKSLEEADTQLKNRKSELQKQEPVFKATRELDIKISETQKQLQPILTAISTHETNKATLQKQLEEKQKELENVTKTLEEKQNWASENKKLENLVTEFSAIESESSALAQSLNEINTQISDIEKLKKELISLQNSYTNSEKTFAEKSKNLTEKEQELKTKQKEISKVLGGKKLSDLQLEKEKITEFGVQISELVKIEKALLSSQNEIKTLEEKEKELSVSIEKVSKKVEVEVKNKATLEEKIAILDENIKLSRTIQSLEEHRQHLKDGEACPLCGALEHPFAQGNVPQIGEKEKELAAAKDKLKKLSDSIGTNQKEQTRLETELKNAQTNKAEKEKTKQENSEKLSNILDEIRQINPDFIVPTDKNKIEVLSEILIQKRKEFNAINEIIGQAGEIENQIENLRDKEIPTLRKEKEEAESAKNKAESQQQLADQNLKIKEKSTLELQERYTTNNNTFLEKLKKYDVESIEILKKCLENWQENSKQITELTTQVTKFSNEIDRTKQDLEYETKSFKEQSETKERTDSEINKLTESRKAIFEDKSVDEEESKLKKLVEDAETAKITAETTKNKAFTDLESNNSVIKSKETELLQVKEKNLTEKPIEKIEESLNELKAKSDELSQKIGANRERLKNDEINRKDSGNKLKEKEKQQAICSKWGALNQLIGSADGKSYRNFAQALTFEHLVHLANKQLRKMSDRYILIRTGDSSNPFELYVIDKYQNSEQRTAQNLSGGEKFIVSLSLALGLANMASKNMRIDTMFIDEGFGTLDADYLDLALNALSNLQSEGKIIGVISHLTELKERIATHVEVVPAGNGHSKIQITN